MDKLAILFYFPNYLFFPTIYGLHRECNLKNAVAYYATFIIFTYVVSILVRVHWPDMAILSVVL